MGLRYALRRFRRTPGFTLAALLTLALAIGANSLIFSVVNAIFLRPLPYRDPGRLFWATEFMPAFKTDVLLAPDYGAWKQQSTSFERLEAMGATIGANVAVAGGPAERVPVAHVTPGFFAMLGVTPQLGAGFATNADASVAIVSDAFSRDVSHADASALGRSLTVNGEPATIVGVMPAGFLYPGAADAAVWLPDAVPPGPATPGRGMRGVDAIGRAKPGVTTEQARADLERITRGMDDQYPPDWKAPHAGARANVIALQQELTADSQKGLMPARGSARAAALVLMGAVAFLLLIACANVANLFLVRAAGRRKEIAMRYAIGAAKWDIVRMLLGESLLLGALGGSLGVALLFWGRSAVKFLLPKALGGAIPIDWRVLAFTALCSLAAGLFFGLLPALTASRVNLNARLHANRSARLPAVLASGQIALSLVLLAGAGLLIRSFLLLASTNPGFDARNVLTASINLRPLEMYGPPQQVEFFNRLIAGIEKVPGVRIAAVSSSPPMAQFNVIGSGLRPDNGPERQETVSFNSVSGNYFELLGIPLISGRFFDSRDARGQPKVAIVNQTLARDFFPGRDPVGHKIGAETTIVGVVADIRHRSLDDKIWPEMFLPFEQSPSSWITVFVRGAGDPSRLAAPIRSVAQSIDASQPLFDIDLLEQRVAGTLLERRERAAVLAAFSILALLIAVVGIYGVMSYSVARRTQEIGIRMAVGAGRGEVLRMVAGAGLRITAAGMIAGLAGALPVTRLLRSFLYGIAPSDQTTFAAVCAILAIAAFCASYLPARRAARVDPVIALRLDA
ncbi:MAG TPA: ABC transporter permease [Bryobacteraceae bacterium]|nr:ABC transporter permease [Bryobacteraceae bacterium]